MEESAVVSVICTTYNQEKYIAQAIESFLAQKTTFHVQIFIGDDSSTDDTPLIIEKYSKKYPDRIIPVLRRENIGGAKNLVDLISRTSSSYIALCDGDDYWTDPLKLQKQYDYMIANPEMSACFHDVAISVETSSGAWFQSDDFDNTSDGSLRWTSGNRRFEKKEKYRIENCILCGFVHTSSMFFRWNYEVGFPNWFYGNGLCDYPLWLMQIGEGMFGYLDEVMSVYRRTDQSVYLFENRNEFWRKTKPSWVRLDKSLIAYFEEQNVRSSILEVLRSRERDDLFKLLKVNMADSLQDSSQQSMFDILQTYRNEINDCFDIDLPSDMSHSNYQVEFKKLLKIISLPPYQNNLRGLIQRYLWRRNEKKWLRY